MIHSTSTSSQHLIAFDSQDPPHNLQGPVKKENVEPLVKKSEEPQAKRGALLSRGRHVTSQVPHSCSSPDHSSSLVSFHCLSCSLSTCPPRVPLPTLGASAQPREPLPSPGHLCPAPGASASLNEPARKGAQASGRPQAADRARRRPAARGGGERVKPWFGKFLSGKMSCSPRLLCSF